MHIWNDQPSDDQAGAPMLPGFEAYRRLPRPEATMPPEARGRIGAQSAALGLGTKVDGEVPPDLAPVELGPVDLKLPETLGAGWTPAVASDVLALAGRVLTIGETAVARRGNAALSTETRPLRRRGDPTHGYRHGAPSRGAGRNAAAGPSCGPASNAGRHPGSLGWSGA